MKITTITAAVLMCCACLGAGRAGAFQCNECHSKNPAMVRMHEAVRGKGCFGCHSVGRKLMGKSLPKDKESLFGRRVADPLCVDCHKKEKTDGE